jgi:hypothetical protein
MAFMNYKEGTGVRARTDLSANVRPTRSYGVSDEELEKVANHLFKCEREGMSLTLVPTLSGKLGNAIVEVLNRRGDG